MLQACLDREIEGTQISNDYFPLHAVKVISASSLSSFHALSMWSLVVLAAPTAKRIQKTSLILVCVSQMSCRAEIFE